MMFFNRKRQYLRAVGAADDVERATAKLKAALRRETDRHYDEVNRLLGELVPTPGGGGNNREEDDVSTGK